LPHLSPDERVWRPLSRSIAANKIKRDSLGGSEINESKLGVVPAAARAGSLAGRLPSAFLGASAKAADANKLDGIDSALVLFPPRADGKAATAVFLEKGDVRGALQQPIDRTLTAPLTPGVGEIQADEQRVVERTTRSRLYEYSYLQAQDGSPIMVLNPALSG